MTYTEKLSYISGLFDGESCFYISRSNNKNGTKSFSCRISIAMNDIEGINIVKEIFGNKERIGSKKINTSTGEDFCPAYILSYSSYSKIKEIINLLTPYLQVKKEQAKLLLEFIEFKKQSGDLSRFRRNGILNNYYIKCKKLKQKNWIINQ